MGNKVTYGLEQVYIAFQGVAQVESIEVLTGCGTDGEITVQVTSAAVTGSPVSAIVPLSTESHSTAAKVASAVANVLNNNSAISAAFRAVTLGATIKLIAKVAAANDATLSIAFTPGSTGVTVGSSTNVTAGTTGWGTPVAIPGAVSFAPKPEGESSTKYADNGPYFVITSNNGYTGDLTMVLVPDTILAEMLGWDIDSNGALIEVADAIPKHFALMGQVQGDSKNRRFVYYDTQVSRPEKEHATKNEKLEAADDVLSFIISPMDLEIGGETKSVVKSVLELSDTNATAYNSFFNSVYVPVAA